MGFCRTYSGHQVDFDKPDKADIFVIDMARALSRIPRYCGHTQEFYSVAQHSVLVANKVYELTNDPVKALYGLVHEISEAYGIGDINGIFKRKLGKVAKKRIHEYDVKLLKEIGVPRGKLPSIIDEVDSQILVDEMRQLFEPKFKDIVQFKHKKYNSCTGYGILIEPEDMDTAMDNFMSAYIFYKERM